MLATWLQEAIGQLDVDGEKVTNVAMGIFLVLGYLILVNTAVASRRLPSWGRYVNLFGSYLIFVWLTLSVCHFRLVLPAWATYSIPFLMRGPVPDTCDVSDQVLLLNGEGGWECVPLSLKTWLAQNVAGAKSWKCLFPSDPKLQSLFCFFAVSVVYVILVRKWLRSDARQRLVREYDEKCRQQEAGSAGLDKLGNMEIQ